MSEDSKRKRSLLSFIKQNYIPLGILSASLVALVFFSWGFIANLIYFADPRHQNQPLESWMTPRYVGMSWDLPPHVIDQVMELRPHIDKRKHLDEVVEDLGITLEELNERVAAIKEQHLISPIKPPKPEKD